jgi:hypothetical protein
VGVHIASVDLDHVRFLHEGLSLLQRQLHAVVAGFDLERETARDVGRRVLTLTGVES